MFGRKKAKRKNDEQSASTKRAPAETMTADEGYPAGGNESAPAGGNTAQLAPGEQAPSQSPPGGLGQVPPLYQHPVPLSSESHGAWRLRQDRGFGFAAGAALVPLNAAEFPLASRHYPIVFGIQGQIALAVLGSAGDNAFVDTDGGWRRGTYVPAYIRRYPFLFLTAPENKFVLSIDDAYEGFGGAGDPLFVEGEASDFTKNALAFCQVFEREIEATAKFIAALEASGLLSSELPSFNRAGGRKLTVKGVRAIDQARLDAVSDATIIEWRQNGWLPAVYAHLTSMSNWDLIGS